MTFPCKDPNARIDLTARGFHVIRGFSTKSELSQGFECPYVRYNTIIPLIDNLSKETFKKRLGWDVQLTKLVARCANDEPQLHRDMIVFSQNTNWRTPPIFSLLVFINPGVFVAKTGSHNVSSDPLNVFTTPSVEVKMQEGDAILMFSTIMHKSDAGLECHGLFPTSDDSLKWWPRMLHLWSHKSFDLTTTAHFPSFIYDKLDLLSEATSGKYKPENLPDDIDMISTERRYTRAYDLDVSLGGTVAMFPNVILKDATPLQNKYLRSLLYEPIPFPWITLSSFPLVVVTLSYFLSSKKGFLYKEKQ